MGVPGSECRWVAAMAWEAFPEMADEAVNAECGVKETE